jgi:hypothetical protein
MLNSTHKCMSISVFMSMSVSIFMSISLSRPKLMFCLCQSSFHIHIHVMSICMSVPSCYWPAVWGGWRGSLSPSTWRGDPLPTPGFLKGDVTTPYSQSIAGITVALLLRGIKREPQPLHSHWRSSSQASLLLPPSFTNSVGGMDGSTDPGTWRWRRTCMS